MNLKNRVQLIGILASDPIIKSFGGNKKLARMMVTTSDIITINNKPYKDIQKHIVVAWDKYAEIAEKSLCSGSEVVIDGRLTTRSYQNASGQMQFITEVVAETILVNNSKVNIGKKINKTA